MNKKSGLSEHGKPLFLLWHTCNLEIWNLKFSLLQAASRQPPAANSQ
jgi:hypothetical protein